jgi:hypothetical protein
MWVTTEHQANRTLVCHRIAADVLSPARNFDNSNISADTIVLLRRSYPRLLKGHRISLGR